MLYAIVVLSERSGPLNTPLNVKSVMLTQNVNLIGVPGRSRCSRRALLYIGVPEVPRGFGLRLPATPIAVGAGALVRPGPLRLSCKYLIARNSSLWLTSTGQPVSSYSSRLPHPASPGTTWHYLALRGPIGPPCAA